jgi:hypothetical protein
MAIAVTRDDRRRRFVADVDGIVKVRDIVALISKQRAGRFRSYALLFDISTATLILTRADAQALSALADSFRAQEGERGPVALVARRPGAYALAKMYAAKGEKRRVRLLRVFRTRGEARSWLTNGP